MSLPWAFICPSSRGIGHALTRHLLRSTTLPILATTRGDASATRSSLLADLPGDHQLARRLAVVPCDVTDEPSIEAAARLAAELFPPKTHHLHLACAVPGILHAEKSPRQVDAADSLESFRVNAVGPLLLIKHFSEFLPRRATQMRLQKKGGKGEGQEEEEEAAAAGLPPHAVWLSMSARVGSVADNRLGGWYSYRASKSAVMSLTKTFDNFLQTRSGDKAVAVAYHPGTVRTDFSREYWDGVEEGKLFSPEYAAERMASVLSGLELGQRGRCWDWKNEEVPP
ncbi:unnamed protein product [Clonostachys rosea f. rosea IK726]|uniref:Uncharacterized protein n=1 Tax=Clonostachys rosea f. rosea IK726 TaxID=1349383 RepID=A0ACA9TJK4_BIOOC|nr:unnamed protein product [Clonostachys rosea f. rosea IK726]